MLSVETMHIHPRLNCRQSQHTALLYQCFHTACMQRLGLIRNLHGNATARTWGTPQHHLHLDQRELRSRPTSLVEATRTVRLHHWRRTGKVAHPLSPKGFALNYLSVRAKGPTQVGVKMGRNLSAGLTGGVLTGFDTVRPQLLQPQRTVRHRAIVVSRLTAPNIYSKIIAGVVKSLRF